MIVEWMFTSEAIKMTKDEMELISIFRSALPVYSSYPKDCNFHTIYIQIQASYGDIQAITSSSFCTSRKLDYVEVMWCDICNWKV